MAPKRLHCANKNSISKMSTTTSDPSQELAEWVKLFPHQVCDTYTSSVTFMKQLTVIVLSKIMYLKNVLPEENYRYETFGGIEQLRILKKVCKDDLAQFVSTALINAFDAFDKKYLHQLVVCFDEGDLAEYHEFAYKYTGEGVTMHHSMKHSTQLTFDTIKEKTYALLRGCLVVSSMLSQYKPSTDISFRLYYNEDAPEGYQAPGFRTPPPGVMEGPLDPGSADHVLYGKVKTPFHQVKASSYIPERTGGFSNEANQKDKSKNRDDASVNEKSVKS